MDGEERFKSRIRMLLLVALVSPAWAQDLRFGAKVGVPLTTYFETGTAPVRGGVVDYSSATRRYTVGPSIEWRPGSHLAVEFGALYKRFGYARTESTSVSGITTNSSLTITGNSWDFPVLAKYRWNSAAAPYIGGGFALRYMRPGRARGATTIQTGTTTTTTAVDGEEGASLFIPGGVASAGLEFGGGRFRLLPELRYTRWRNTNLSGPLLLSTNQFELLLGILF